MKTLRLLTIFVMLSIHPAYAADQMQNPRGFTDTTTGMEFVYVPGGCFKMGDSLGDGDDDERPAHEVCLKGYYIGKYEVTYAQYHKFKPKHDNGSYGKNSFNVKSFPATNINWNDAVNFSQWLTQKSGRQYRLPTEAEWEYAARSGGKSEEYSGSNNVNAVAWYGPNGSNTMHSVGQKQANGLGIHDMSGNAWEYVNDWYSNDYYTSSPSAAPQGPTSGTSRVIRGGNFGQDAKNVRTHSRNHMQPNIGLYDNGFRLVSPAP